MQLNARLTHNMPDDLHQKLKEIAVEQGTNVTALINSVMYDYAGMSTDPNFFTEIRKRVEALEKEVFKSKK